MIPATLHVVWLGSCLPAFYEHNLDRFRSLNPRWSVEIWDDARLAPYPLKNREAFDSATVPAMRSDIARLEILFDCGGLYADGDVQWLRPVDAGLIPSEDMTWFAREDLDVVNAGVIASPAHSAVLGRLIEALPLRVARHWKPTGFLPEVTGSGLLMQVLPSLPAGWVGVWPLTSIARPGVIAPRAYGVHHFAGSWLPSAKRD